MISSIWNHIRRMEEAGVLLFYGAFEKDRIVGVIAVRGLSTFLFFC